MTTRRRTAAAVAALTAAVLVAGPAAARTPDPATGPPAAEAATGTTTEETVTLVTGDRVALVRTADGRRSVTLEPSARPDGRTPVFEAYDEGDGLYVIPSDAAPLVPEVLDRELFNITKLAEGGHQDGVPVVVAYPDVAASQQSRAGITAVSRFDSLDAAAATIDATGRWWRAISTATVTRAGIEKVWLDETVEVSLDNSVPAVGADQAWQRGYDGSGVTVAVLDTGIETGHPDLAGKVMAEKNFSSSDTVQDVNGHGTHVAGTVAGTGAASDSTYVGVAPGATLLNGKVLGDDGTGQMSQLIQGMEWAVDQGADVVNISLGGDPTDGTDPASVAVDQLTAAHDVLFVVAAGNTGPREFTVTAPGTASAALTVGADDREAFRPFSAQGPRLGDYAIKPDIIAPGINIVAPRAAGSTLGPVVDEDYMRLTGTSMATPHVAGAAAILRQREPELDAATLKAGLTGTAEPFPNGSVYRQGGGQLYIPSTLDAPVWTDDATLDFGYLRYPHGDSEPVTMDLTYQNQTDEAVTLDLALDVASQDRTVPPPAMLSVSPAKVTMDPGESATATVTVDATAGEFGRYDGYLVASRDGQVANTTPLAFYKEPELYDLDLTAVTADGDVPTVGLEIMDLADRRDFFQPVSFAGGSATVRLPPGTYSVMGGLYLYDEDGTLTDVVVVGDPEVTVAGDTTVALDATTASPVTLDTPEHDVAPSGMLQASYRRTDDRPGSTPYTRTILAPATGPDTPQISAMATEEVTRGLFAYFTHLRLRTPGPEPSPVLYDVMLPETGQIPADLRYELDPAELVRIDNRFHSGVPGRAMGEVRHGWRPWQTNSWRVVEPVPAGSARTEYVIGGDTLYRQQVRAGGALASQGQLVEPEVYYEPGTSHERTWFAPVGRPGLRQGVAAAAPDPVERTGDTLRLQLAEWVDGQTGHWGELADPDTAEFRLYQDGELVAQQPRPQDTFPMSPDPATYRLELDVARDADWWTTSVATRTAWTVQSAPPKDDGTELLPLLLIDYDIDVDLSNTALPPAERRGPPVLGLDVSHQPGADAPPVAGLRLSVSYDDGDTWTSRPARPAGPGSYRAHLPLRPGQEADHLSLRVEAWDAAGNRIEQEITRAWALPTD